MIFIDTNVAIDLRDDNDGSAALRLLAITASPVIPMVTLIELEGGVGRDPALAPLRRALLDRMLAEFEVATLTLADVAAYGRIIAARGFDRRRILDRLIAAQTLVRRGQLVTRNVADFSGIDGLTLIAW